MTALDHPPVRNKVTWVIDPGRCALLLHDLQPHYLAALDDDRRRLVLANARVLGHACRERGIPIFASLVPVAAQGAERGLMADMWGEGPPVGGGELAPGLDLDGAPVRPLVKRGYSAFYGNDFEVLLRRLGCDSLLVAGLYTSIGCQATAMDAFMRDIRAFVVADATADLTPADHRAGLDAAARTCARIVDTASVCRRLARRPSAAPGLGLGRFDVC